MSPHNVEAIVRYLPLPQITLSLHIESEQISSRRTDLFLLTSSILVSHILEEISDNISVILCYIFLHLSLI